MAVRSLIRSYTSLQADQMRPHEPSGCRMSLALPSTCRSFARTELNLVGGPAARHRRQLAPRGKRLATVLHPPFALRLQVFRQYPSNSQMVQLSQQYMHGYQSRNMVAFQGSAVYQLPAWTRSSDAPSLRQRSSLA